jgi:exosortase
MRAVVLRRPALDTAGVALALALLVLYAPVVKAVAAVWSEIPYYSYGFLVPLFSAYLAWDARHELMRRPRVPSAAGLGLVGVGLGLLAAGMRDEALSVQALSLPVVGAGAVAATHGWARTRVLAFALGFLVFMAPLPDGVLPALSLPLQHVAAVAAEWMLWFIGVPVTRDGLFLMVPSVTLHVTEACNGLRFLLAMLVVGTAFAGTTQTRWGRRAVVVAAALGAAIVANWLRVAGTGIMAEMLGHDAATGMVHVVWGKVVYAAMLIPFMLLVVALRRRA